MSTLDAPITQGEAFALRHALQNVEFRNALSMFFTSQAEDAIRQCYDAMKQSPPQIERAIGCAAQAKMAEDSVNTLEDYIRKQLERT